MKMRVLLLLLCLPCAASAQTYSFSGLSSDDVLTIGRALDKLLGTDPADRVFTDRARLYQRVQAQITEQSAAMTKARTDAEKAAFDKAVADAIEKAKTDKEPAQ